MSDVVFRTKTVAEPNKSENIVIDEEVHTERVHEQVPYTEYQRENGKPFVASYYNLGDTWEVFNDEISTIEGYLRRKVDNGEIANEVKTIENELKKMEKLHNLKDETRVVLKMGILASYIKFLNDTEGYKTNLRKYGNT